jgi:hypothetical protein
MDTRVDRDSRWPANQPPAAHDSSARDGAESATMDPAAPADSVVADAFKLLLQQLRELREYANYYASAKSDTIKLSLQNALLWVALAAVGFVVACGVCVTASCLLLFGVAEGLSVVFGGRLWVGNLLTGGLMLAGFGGGMYGLMVAYRRASRARTVQEYEKRQALQETRYGHNVSERAAGASSQQQ